MAAAERSESMTSLWLARRADSSCNRVVLLPGVLAA